MDALPVGWIWSPLGQVAAVQLGKMLDRAKNFGELRPYLRNINVRWFDFDLGDLAQIRMSVSEAEKFTIQNGDVLVCEGGEPGRCAVWLRGATDLTYQKALHRVRVSDALRPSLLTRQLRLDALTGSLEDHLSGSTIKHLPQAALKRYPVRLPPPKEQERITDKLDTVLARVDTCRNRLAHVALLLKRFRQSVLVAATSGLLTRNLCQTDANASTVGLFVSLSDCCSLDVGYAFKSAEFQTAGVRLLRGDNIEPGKLRWADAKFFPANSLVNLSHLLLNDGDIVLAMDRPIISTGLKIARVKASDLPAVLVQRVCRFKPEATINADFLYCVLRSTRFIDHLKRSQNGSDIPHISGNQILRFSVSLPSVQEQAEIVRRVESLFAYADRLEARLTNARTAVDRLTPALLAKAFRGELVPQDPNDEPASELLRRLAESRQAAPAKPRRRKAA